MAPSGPSAHLSMMSTFNEDEDVDGATTVDLDLDDDWMSASAITLAAVGSPPPALMSFRLISKISNTGTSRDVKRIPRARPP